MKGYGGFSAFYDTLMGHAAYEERGEYLLSLFSRFGAVPDSLLDLACGTGRMTRFLAAKGIDMVGIDASPEMLCRARDESIVQNADILWICQDLRELDLYGTAGGAVSTYDSFNHLTSLDDITQFFHRLHFFIEPGGLFVFDANTPYKHKEVLANNTFVYDTPAVYCVWQNSLTEEQLQTNITLDFFVPIGDGRYEKTREQFSERAYTTRQIMAAAGDYFELLDVYDDLTFLPPKADSQRLIYVLKKR